MRPPGRSFLAWQFILAMLVAWAGCLPAGAAPFVVQDIFGRDVTRHGLVLVDWEGYLANPATKFYLVPPADAAYPARAVLSGTEQRLYFDLPSEAGPRGPRKEVVFQKPGKVAVHLAIFPDREAKDLDLVIKIEFTDKQKRSQTIALPVHVIDQDKPAGKQFPLLVDFSQDRTGFFKDDKHRAVIRQAADDWAELLGDMDLDPVPAGREKTHIWNPDGFKSGRVISNAKEYTGYLLYAYGIKGQEVRSGGEPSREGSLQTARGKNLAIHRSGGLEIEIQGNYNKKGWLVGLKDSEWWKATNLGDVPNDLYSIAHHEMGHSLIFNPANPLFDKAKKKGKLTDAPLRAYLGSDPKIDKADHLNGTIDPASLRGAYGFEYHGKTPYGRWLITKTDLLVAQAIGFKLRKTSAFQPLELSAAKLPAAALNKKYTAKLTVTGGIPFYCWDVTAGSLPLGLELDSFTGTLHGTPSKPGTFEFTVRVRDYTENAKGQSRPCRLEVDN